MQIQQKPPEREAFVRLSPHNTKLKRSNTGNSSEYHDEMRGVAETALFGDFFDTERGCGKLLFGDTNAHGLNKLVRCGTAEFFEFTHVITGAQHCHAGEIFIRKIWIGIVRFDI